MTLKQFNHGYSFISNSGSSYSLEDEAHLHCLLKETTANSQPEDFIDGIQELPIMLYNLHQIINKCDPKSGPFGKSVELVDKIILSLRDKPDILETLPILPVLTDVLLRSSSRNEYILKMIQDVSFGIIIKTCQPYIERLIKFCVKTLCDDTVEYDDKLRNMALSVLINLCGRNIISLSILEQQINLIDLQKKIPLEKYGILTCKMNLILDKFGNILRDSDVRNFLKFTSKELHRIPSLDEKSLKHLIEFIRDISQRSSTKQILQGYDFCSGIQAAIMILENTTDNNITVHTNSLFEIIKIVTTAKNDSLKNLVITVINFAIKRLKCPEYCIQALETLATVFNHDVKISTNNFEMEEMQETLKAILYSNERHHTTMAPLFKLLNVLAQNYKLNLLKNQIVDSIFAPLLRLESANYFKLPIGEITMYLEALSMLATLLENNLLETRSNLFQATNIQFLVAMSIKHGNTDQCCLALNLMERFSKRNISEIISAKINENKTNDPHLFFQNNKDSAGLGKDLSKEFGNERVKNVFFNIEKACLNEKIEVPSSDFIELYTNQIAMLKQQIEILTKKYEDVSNEINVVNGHNVQLQITSMKWSELAQNLQKTNETIISDNEKLNAIVTSLRSQIKSTLGANEEAIRKLTQEKIAASRKNKDMEEKVQSLEEELKDTEDMRQTILSLMSKRKKASAKESG